MTILCKVVYFFGPLHGDSKVMMNHVETHMNDFTVAGSHDSFDFYHPRHTCAGFLQNR